MCEVEGGNRRESGLILLAHLHFNAEGIKRTYITQNAFYNVFVCSGCEHAS